MNGSKTAELLSDIFFRGESERQAALVKLAVALEDAWQVLTADIPWLHVGNQHTLAKLSAVEAATPRYVFAVCGSPEVISASRHADLLSNGLRSCLFAIGRQARDLAAAATPGQPEYEDDITAARLDLALDITTPRPPNIFTSPAPVMVLTAPPQFHLVTQQQHIQEWYLGVRFFGMAPAASRPVQPPSDGPGVTILPRATSPPRYVVNQ